MPTMRRLIAAAVITVVAACASDAAAPATTVPGTTTSTTSTKSRTTSTAVTTAAAAAATSSIAPSTTVASTAGISGTLTAAQVAGELGAAEVAAVGGDGSVGVRQQLLYRYLAAHPELDDAVLAAVGDRVRPYVERIVRAREFGQARQAANPGQAPPSTTLPAWTVIEPAPAEELLADYHDAETATGIGWYWLAAIHLQETRMGRIVGTSSAGAVGPMQFLPATWDRCCAGDPTVTRDAVLGAATYLAQSGGLSDMAAALHVYNPNDSYVATVTAFAENLRDDPQLYAAYRQWQVFYATSAGTVRLPVGYSQTQPIDAAAYLADHPADAAG